MQCGMDGSLAPAQSGLDILIIFNSLLPCRTVWGGTPNELRKKAFSGNNFQSAAFGYKTMTVFWEGYVSPFGELALISCICLPCYTFTRTLVLP